MTKVMVIEDNTDLQQTISRDLMRNGYATMTTAAELECVEGLLASCPDVILFASDSLYDDELTYFSSLVCRLAGGAILGVYLKNNGHLLLDKFHIIYAGIYDGSTTRRFPVETYRSAYRSAHELVDAFVAFRTGEIQ